MRRGVGEMRGDVFVCGDRLEPREDGFGCLGVWEGGFGYLEPREGAEREAAAAALRHVCSRGRLGRACVVVGRRLRLGDRAGVRRGEESREVDLLRERHRPRPGLDQPAQRPEELERLVVGRRDGDSREGRLYDGEQRGGRALLRLPALVVSLQQRGRHVERLANVEEHARAELVPREVVQPHGHQLEPQVRVLGDRSESHHRDARLERQERGAVV
mmetsp:Transcript_15707/g.50754  ORF Transcript_15707/g.50754 Transcript_15707/m.50754 type:complete len:216 (-) Transcript_15707:150-797(-)